MSVECVCVGDARVCVRCECVCVYECDGVGRHTWPRPSGRSDIVVGSGQHRQQQDGSLHCTMYCVGI